jgi:cytochrome c oxidase cbb3-type subunit 4
MQTIYAWANALWPLWLMILFLGIVAWAFWPKRKARFEKDAQIPLRDDDEQDR